MVHSEIAERFSITRGGVVRSLLVRYFGVRPERERVVRRAVAVTLFSWLPLAILSLIEGVAYGHGLKIPFFKDFAVNARFLIALPILILAESPIDRRWHTLIMEFLRSGLVKQKQLPDFEKILLGIQRLRDSFIPEFLLFLVSFVPSALHRDSELLMWLTTNWHVLPDTQQISLAGWWFNLISTPLFRFLIFRWLWREILWTLFLWKSSRIHLHLVPTHTDLAAGLGFLSEGQVAFTPIVFAGSTVIASQVANAILYEGATLHTLRYLMIGYAVGAVLVLVLPLLAVTPELIRVKKHALFEYGALVTHHNQQFHDRWILGETHSKDAILGSPDASSLGDLGSSFTVVQNMSYFPVDKPTLIGLAISAMLPMLPVIVFATPLNELISLLVKTLF